ncbi:MAG: type II toxin-antitoxin system prevent-host-death family antitoxin [Candidatus Methylomirabilia bacterium]
MPITLGEIMKEVQRGRVRVLVEKSGVPMVGIISADDFQRVIVEREARFEAVDRSTHGLHRATGLFQHLGLASRPPLTFRIGVPILGNSQGRIGFLRNAA